MRTPKDPVEVVATLKESIDASPTKSRRLLLHTIRSLFGWKAWTVPHRELATRLLTEQGILAQPSIADAGLDDWITFSVPPKPPRPDDEWFHGLMSAAFVSEVEVEMRLICPLFRKLNYDEIHEAAGFGFLLYEGRSRKRVQADLVYFADEHHSKQGMPLVVVEAKGPGQKLDDATEQARSYASSLRPAYYVVTNGDLLTVWSYQGAVRDTKKMEFKREQLPDLFDELYRLLNRETVIEARKVLMDRLAAK